MEQNFRMVRGEEALNKERFKLNRKGAPHYRVEDNDIIFLTGPYANEKISVLWFQGSEERDYIFKYLYNSKDSVVQGIVKQFFCK